MSTCKNPDYTQSHTDQQILKFCVIIIIPVPYGSPQLLTQLSGPAAGQFWGGHAAARADRDRAVVKGTAAELPMEKGGDHGAGIQKQHGSAWAALLDFSAVFWDHF